MRRAKTVFFHDDPPCKTELSPNGICPDCKFVPDMQSMSLEYRCPDCNIPLKHMACPKCYEHFMR